MNPSNKRIVKNTGLLYLRMAIVMVLNLYTVRLVLNCLGAQDYGIFDVIAGVITMFQSISGVLSISTQRFFSYALGENDSIKFQKLFTSSISVYVTISIIILLICETIGLWFINTHLVIPSERMVVANILFQYSLFSFIFTMMQTPFLAAVISNEDMGLYAIISFVESVLKFLAVLCLPYICFDKLSGYGFFLFAISLCSLIVYILITILKYPDCKYKRVYNVYCKELIVFSGWTFIGSTSGVCMNQVCTIIVNIFFGPITNAARAIAAQVSGTLSAFCGNFLTATRPPVVKAYADKNYDYLNNLFHYSNILIYYMLLMLIIPFYLEMEFILKLWLDIEDGQTVLFSKLALIYTLILSLSHPITYIIHATGYVKQYHLLVEIPTLAVMPVTYVAFKLGAQAYSTYIILVFAMIFSHIIRIACLKKYYPQFQLKKYITTFVSRSICVTVISIPLIFYFHNLLEPGVLRFFITILLSSIILLFFIIIIGISNKEKVIVKGFVTKMVNSRFSDFRL